MKRPSVLFINRVYPPHRGATGRVLRDLAKGFAREGWQVHVLTTGPKAVKERDGPIKIKRIKAPNKPVNFLSYLLIWIRLLIAGYQMPKTHLVVSMTDPPLLAVIGQILAKTRRMKHVHWCQDLYPDILKALDVKPPGLVNNMLLGFSRWAMRSADKVIVIGRCMARHLTYSGIDPKRITVIPNWPDSELTRPASIKKRAFSKSMGRKKRVQNSKDYSDLLKSGPKFRVLYAGNIGLAHPYKSLLAAAKHLNDNHPEIEFIFVGEGPRFDHIAQYRSQHNLENIRLLPYQPNSRLQAVMESGDIHVISMHEEAAGCLVPSKLYSALAVSRPSIFIGPEHSEVAKVIHDFHAGSIVPANEPEQLIKAITHYRENGEAWFEAHQGAKSASEVFVPKDAIEAWIKRAWSVIEADLRGSK